MWKLIKALFIYQHLKTEYRPRENTIYPDRTPLMRIARGYASGHPSAIEAAMRLLERHYELIEEDI